MVNITIDFKNNKIYLRRPRLIKGGVYRLSIDPADKLIRVIQTEVLELLATALESFSKCNTMYAENEYIQYDYNRVKHRGFLKLIRNGNEIIHLSIFTGNKSTPHLTFNDINGTTIHLYLADLELNSFNDNKSTTYAAILRKYNRFEECESTRKFFYDLLNLINVKLDYITHRDLIKQYYTQLKYYINAFMNILANPGPSTIYKGNEPSENTQNTQTTLTNMMTVDQFTEEILNYEINKKITSIKVFVKSNNGRLTAFNSLINEFIKHENTSLNMVIKAIKTYEFYKSFPITDNDKRAFSYTEVFQTEADIDAFIAEFEKNKKLVESVKLSPEVELSSATKSSLSKFDEVVNYIANINFLFNAKTHDNLTMILNIQEKKIELARSDANRLEKFMRRCRETNNDLHNLLNKNTIATNKIQALAKSKKEQEPSVQTGQTAGGKTKATPSGKTKATPSGKTKATPNAKTKAKSLIKRRSNSTTLKKK
tara:strand:+ start:785 stop:2236 length:1452 start_codon:yes stop_codon:yes gene_type:complete